MKPPWINHSKMREISSNQLKVFTSATPKVQNISISLNLTCTNEARTEEDDDSCEFDPDSSRVDKNATNHSFEIDDRNHLSEQHNRNHTDSIDDHNELTDVIDPIPDSKVEEFTETEGIFKLADTNDGKHELNPSSADETEETPQTDLTNSSETDDEDDETIGTVQTNYDEHGKGCYQTKKSPFSIHVEMDDFLHAPICGSKVQNTFEFLNQTNNPSFEYDTKLLNTKTFYPDQPDCHLVCSTIHEISFFTDSQTYGTNNKNHHSKSVAVPLHDSPVLHTGEATNDSSDPPHDFMHIRVPVVIGEYNIELCLEESIVFEEEVMRVKEITKEVILTNFRLVPIEYSQALTNGTRTVVKGIFFIEGYIYQKIEYISSHKRNTDSFKELCQKMVVELMIQIQQIQQVRVAR